MDTITINFRFKKKAVISLFLSLALIGSTASYADEICMERTNESCIFPAQVQEMVTHYLNDYPNMRNEILETVDIIENMPSYISAYERDPNIAYGLMQSGLNNLVRHSEVSTQGASYNGLFYADYTVPYVAQSTTVNCGIAASLQAAIGNNYLANTDSNKSASKQTQLAKYVEYNENGTQGAQAYEVRNIMNHFKSGIYEAIPVTTISVDYVINDMENSFINGYCPVIQINRTIDLGYYNNNYVHWVTVSQINRRNNTITIIDPFNDNIMGGKDSSYGGVHTVNIDDFIDAIGVGYGVDSWVILDTMHPEWAA